MSSAHEAGRAAWPEIALARDAFGAYLAERGLPPDAENGSDLYLACACLAQLPAALRAFEATFLPQLPTYLARLRPSPALVDEVAQRLRERLFVGASPRIAEYSGKGSLGGWLRVVAARIGLDLVQTPQRTEALSSRQSLAAAARSPELELLRNRHREQFQQAFAAALQALSGEQRTLIRLHYLDGLPMEALGKMFGVNRSTIFRRLSACSTALLDGMRRRLGAELGISTAELESLADALQSDFELSLGDYLKSSA